VTTAAAASAALRRLPTLLLTATAVAVVALVMLPLVYLVLRVASNLDRALDALLRRSVLELVLNTALLVGAVTAAAVVVAVPLAWLVTRTDLPARRFFAVAAALPLVVPSYVVALALIALFGPRGMLQQALEGPFGVERVPDLRGFLGAFVALTLATYPYVFLLAAAALRELDPALEEAARSLGRGATSTFFRVTLPVIRPSIGAGALLVALYAISDFGVVSLMNYDALTRAIFVSYRALFDRTPAAVLGLVLVALTAVIVYGEARTRRRVRYHRSTPGSARRRPPVALGRWRWPVTALVSLGLGFALLVPVGVLCYWVARAISLGIPLGIAWEAALNSVLVSLVAAAAAVLAALPVATLAVRYPRPFTGGLERLSYSSNALPGIVIALSLVYFAANYTPSIYQTLLLLVVAYVIRFFPQAVAGAHSALLRVNPRLEEAGRGLGQRPVEVFARVTVPLVAPGLLTGAALVFLSTMKELPVTLLLRPIGFETLATEVWSATSLGAYSRAAVPGLLLIVASAPILYLLTRRGAGSSGPPG
jgi:iron(III) transport system permease protein